MQDILIEIEDHGMPVSSTVIKRGNTFEVAKFSPGTVINLRKDVLTKCVMHVLYGTPIDKFMGHYHAVHHDRFEGEGLEDDIIHAYKELETLQYDRETFRAYNGTIELNDHTKDTLLVSFIN